MNEKEKAAARRRRFTLGKETPKDVAYREDRRRRDKEARGNKRRPRRNYTRVGRGNDDIADLDNPGTAGTPSRLERYLIGKLKQLDINQGPDAFYLKLNKLDADTLSAMLSAGFWPSAARAIVARHVDAKMVEYSENGGQACDPVNEGLALLALGYSERTDGELRWVLGIINSKPERFPHCFKLTGERRERADEILILHRDLIEAEMKKRPAPTQG